MSEKSEKPENAGIDEAIGGKGGEGKGAAAGTPKIGEDAEKGKTTQSGTPRRGGCAPG